MNAPTYIVGHRNPDTDSIASATALAWLYQKTRPAEQFIPLSLGPASPQTQWLYNQAGLALPEIKKDIRPTVGEYCQSMPTVEEQTPLSHALRLMRQAAVDAVAVCNQQDSIIGIISDRLPRTNYLLTCNMEEFLGTVLNLQDIVQGLSLTSLNQAHNPHSPQRIVLGLAERSSPCEANDLLILGDQPKLLAEALAAQAGAVIFCDISDERAHQLGAPLPIPAYTYAGTALMLASQLPGCFPAPVAMETRFQWLEADMILSQAHHTVAQSQHALPVLGPSREVLGCLSPQDLLSTPARRVCLVDHCEKHQSIHGLEEAQIIEIVDHHRLGDIETSEPLSIDCRPLGSTASIHLPAHVPRTGEATPGDSSHPPRGADCRYPATQLPYHHTGGS